jgi:magnesium and cobalt exporter, CNNM family
MIALEIATIIIIVLCNGFFAMSELAIVSSRRPRLQHLAANGDERARVALTLVDNPSRFLAVVQIGMTLTAILAGIFSGATIADRLGDWLDSFQPVAHLGKPVAIALVFVVVAYFSLLLGELVPKQVGLANPERVALRVAPPLAVIARVGSPLVSLLDFSVRNTLRILGVRPASRRKMTAEEIRGVIAEGAESGVIHAAEREMIEEILFLSERAVRTIMTARPDVSWIDLDDSDDIVLKKVRECSHTQLLVGRGAIDEIQGIVDKQDLLDQAIDGREFDVKGVLQPPLIVHETATILRTLDLFKKTPAHTGAVIDEYGVVQGIVTRTDLLEAIAGDLPDLDAEAEPKVTRREDGSFLIDATMPIAEAAECLGIPDLSRGDFLTLAGFVLFRLDHVPKAGEHFTWSGRRFEVFQMEGRRIDKVLVQPVSQESPAAP